MQNEQRHGAVTIPAATVQSMADAAIAGRDAGILEGLFPIRRGGKSENKALHRKIKARARQRCMSVADWLADMIREHVPGLTESGQ